MPKQKTKFHKQDTISIVKAAQVPIVLDFSVNDDDGVPLEQILIVAQAPITLDFRSNRIGPTFVELLARAIQAARAPLVLNLLDNDIGDSGAITLAGAIQRARVPLTLDLRRNGIGDIGAKSLAFAIAMAKIPLTIDLNYNCVKDLSELNYAMANNFVIDAGSDPSKFLSRIRFSLSRKILEQESSCPTVVAKLIQDYISDDELAWLEVAAIRAVEGASNLNKYSSINYELLSMTYFKVPQIVQPLIEVERLSTTESEEGKNYTSSTVDSNENKNGNNINTAQNSGSNLFSYSLHELSSVYDGNHPKELSFQRSIELSYIPGTIQILQNDNSYYVETLLATVFAWIKDLPKYHKQQILSSFSIQRVLKVLETISYKVIAEQLGGNKLKEIFTAKHQNYYGQDEYVDNSQSYAQIKNFGPARLLCGTIDEILDHCDLLQT